MRELGLQLERLEYRHHPWRLQMGRRLLAFLHQAWDHRQGMRLLPQLDMGNQKFRGVPQEPIVHTVVVHVAAMGAEVEVEEAKRGQSVKRIATTRMTHGTVIRESIMEHLWPHHFMHHLDIHHHHLMGHLAGIFIPVELCHMVWACDT